MRQPDAEDAANSKRGRASGFWETCSERRQAIYQITEHDVLASGECCREKDALYEEGDLSGQWDRERDGLSKQLNGEVFIGTIASEQRPEQSENRQTFWQSQGQAKERAFGRGEHELVYSRGNREDSHVSGTEKWEDLLSAIFHPGDSTISLCELGWAMS